MPKLVRITTVPVSMMVLLKGQLKFMKQNGFEVTMISSEGPEVAQLTAQENCPHIAVKLTRKITPFTDFISLVKLTFLLRKIKPDIVHTHTPKAGLIGMWAAKLAGVKIRLHTIAGLPWMESKGMVRRLLIAVEKMTALAASSVFPNSFVQKDFLFKNGVAVDKMKVIGNGSSNGIDTGYFSKNLDIENQAKLIRQRQRINEDAWVWIFVGRIVKDKGITELVDAFLEIQQQFPEDRLLLLGEQEPHLDPLDEKYISLLKSHHAIICCGFQKDIRPYLASSQVLVFPSYREGFPNVPMQAGAMGCALILSDINGCNEIVNQGKDGWLVPVKNVSALATAMMEARNNPAQTKLFAEAIQKKIELGYAQSYLWDCLLHEYQELLNSTKS
jgi:glycosyltransferase involved in cell wall biosynthesis